MTDEQFAEYHVKFQRSIYAIARKIAGPNENMYDDLVQVGTIALWRFNLDKVQTNVVGCINRHLRNRMIDFVRAEQPKAKLVTLDDSQQPRADCLFIDDAGMAVEARLSRHDVDYNGNDHE